jgi:hypothetical protein
MEMPHGALSSHKTLQTFNIANILITRLNPLIKLKKCLYLFAFKALSHGHNRLKNEMIMIGNIPQSIIHNNHFFYLPNKKGFTRTISHKPLISLVGGRGFEPPTSTV